MSSLLNSDEVEIVSGGVNKTVYIVCEKAYEDDDRYHGKYKNKEAYFDIRKAVEAAVKYQPSFIMSIGINK